MLFWGQSMKVFLIWLESSRILIQNSSRFFTFYVIFRHIEEKFEYRNRKLDKIAVMLVVDLVFYVRY